MWLTWLWGLFGVRPGVRCGADWAAYRRTGTPRKNSFLGSRWLVFMLLKKIGKKEGDEQGKKKKKKKKKN